MKKKNHDEDYGSVSYICNDCNTTWTEDLNSDEYPALPSCIECGSLDIDVKGADEGFDIEEIDLN